MNHLAFMKEIDGELVFATPISRIKKMDGELNAFLARVMQSRCATNNLLSIKHIKPIEI